MHADATAGTSLTTARVADTHQPLITRYLE
jgi:hypothetical protein